MLGDSYRKVNWDGKAVSLVWERQADNASKPAVHSLHSPDAPAPEFVEALQGLKPFVRQVCQFSAIWMENVQIVGVTSMESKDGEIALIVTAAKPLDGPEAPLLLNTPAYLATGIVLEQLNAIAFAADHYRDGVRAQGDLFGKALENGMRELVERHDWINEVTINGPGRESVTIRRQAVEA